MQPWIIENIKYVWIALNHFQQLINPISKKAIRILRRNDILLLHASFYNVVSLNNTPLKSFESYFQYYLYLINTLSQYIWSLVNWLKQETQWKYIFLKKTINQVFFRKEHVRNLISKEVNNIIYISTIKGLSPLALSV